ncbi:hypothetical protein C8Q80DRAFT_885294 [Daedaleopsis nitida]|nr:hypothetical protein C8Q80DRAFT_885294 [Daedaleopsis nitida]
MAMATFEKELEMNDGEDKDDMVIFAGDCDVVAYLAGGQLIEEATRPNIALPLHEASSTDPVAGSPTPLEVFFSDSPLTTLSELSDDEYQEPCMEAQHHLAADNTDRTALRSNHKVERGLKSSYPSTTHAPAHHKKSKRHLKDAPPDTRTHAGSAVPVDNGRRNPRKRSKLRAPEPTSSRTLVEKSPRTPLSLPPRPPAVAPTSQPPKPRNGGIFYGSTGKKGKKKKKNPHKGRSRGSAMGAAGEGDGHATQRAAKRQRGEDGPNAIDASNEAIRAHQPRRNPPRASQQHDGQRAGGPSGIHRGPAVPIDHPIKSAATMSSSRKRSLDEGIAATGVDHPGSRGERKVAKLPKSGRKRLRDTVTATAPRPSSTSLGIPANLVEADRMMSSLGKEAVMGLQDTTPQADAWPADGRARDERPPSDDEDDEDDEDEPTALRQVIPPPCLPAQDRKEPEGQIVLKIKIPAGCMTPGLPSTVLTPVVSGDSTLRMSATPAPVMVSNEPLLPKRPLTAQPIIWAKVRLHVSYAVSLRIYPPPGSVEAGSLRVVRLVQKLPRRSLLQQRDRQGLPARWVFCEPRSVRA